MKQLMKEENEILREYCNPLFLFSFLHRGIKLASSEKNTLQNNFWSWQKVINVKETYNCQISCMWVHSKTAVKKDTNSVKKFLSKNLKNEGLIIFIR